MHRNRRNMPSNGWHVFGRWIVLELREGRSIVLWERVMFRRPGVLTQGGVHFEVRRPRPTLLHGERVRRGMLRHTGQ
jgi:hypothetical protein